MDSRDRVLAAFAHEEPDRVPVWCGASDEFWIKATTELGLDDEELRQRFGDDFRRVYARYAGPEFPLSEGATYRTIFGIERAGLGYGQPLSHPLANATLAEIHDYPWPDPMWTDVSGIADYTARSNGEYAVLGGDWSPFWHDLIDLLGMETMYLKMYDEPELVDAILTHMVDYYATVSQRIFDAAGDAIDVLLHRQRFRQPAGTAAFRAMFRRFLLPHLARLVDLGHAYDLKVMPPLLRRRRGADPGHDRGGAWTACTRCNRAVPEWSRNVSSREFGDKILFNGAIDSHHVLIEGTPDFVREKTRETLEIMMPGGGYVAGASHDTILEETPVENVLAMFDAVREFGVYHK
jgi:uroporphyrinogen decarboxylase